MQIFQALTWTLYPEDEGCILCVRSYGAKFHLEYFSENLVAVPAVLESCNNYINVFKSDDDDSDNDSAMTPKEAAKELMRPFEPIMARLAPKGPASSALYDYCYPQQFCLKAEAAQNDTIVQPRTSDEQPVYIPPGELMSLTRARVHDLMDLTKEVRDVSKWEAKRYSSRQVEIPLPAFDNRDPRICGPREVFVDNRRTKCFFKPFRPNEGDPVLRATHIELCRYSQIETAIAGGHLTPELRVCRLHGVVIDNYDDLPKEYRAWGKGEHLVGLLLTYIEPRKGYGCSSLLHMSEEFIKEHGPRFDSELQIVIENLHEAGVVWGDAKPGNVLVDKDDNIWLIDFGGEYTPGWVDKSKKNTKEGDLQGLERIRSWLANEGRFRFCGQDET